MSINRFPPDDDPRQKKKPAEDIKSDNALWRIPEWFPNLDPKVLEGLKTYHAELLKFNGRLNLISRSSEREADETHFADAVLGVQLMQKAGISKTVYDIGSGNGIPGLVLAMMNPSVTFHLVESDSRKCEFVKHCSHVLKLSNCKVMNVRVESLGANEMSEAVSRGFASISKTLLSVNRLFTEGDKFFHFKGSNWSREIAELPSQLISVWNPELVGEYSLPVSQARRAVVVTIKSKV